MSDFNVSAALSTGWLIVGPLTIKLLAALILLVIGWLIARAIEKGLVFVLKLILLDKLANWLGWELFVLKGGLKQSLSEMIGSLVYWLITMVVVINVADLVGLPVTSALPAIFAYMGTVFLAALVMALGVFLAGLVSGIIRLIMANLGLEGARTVSRFIYYIIIIVSFLVALSHLGFNPDWGPQMGIILGAPALAAAIAFGLGCKDMAADFIYNIFKGK
jgi:hypothetical protein